MNGPMRSLALWARRHHSLIYWAAVVVISFLAVLLSVQGVGRSLWLDEAWVANAILEQSLSEAWFYDAWAQTEPPLFIALARVIVGIFGTDERVLRVIPVAAHVATIPLLALVAKRFLPASLALASTLTLAFDPELLVLSRTAKHYSSSVFSTIVVLLACWRFVERQDRWSLLVAVGVIIGFGALSYQTFMFLPPLLISLLFGHGGRGLQATGGGVFSSGWSRRRLRWSIGVVVVCGVAAGLLYWVFVVPNRSGQLLEYWATWYAEWSMPAEALSLYGRSLSEMADFVFVHDRLAPLTAGMMFVGWLFPSQPRDSARRGRHPVRWFLLGPVVVAAVLNMAHLYPVGPHRLTAFLAPVSILGFWLGWARIAKWLADRDGAGVFGQQGSRIELFLCSGGLALVVLTLVVRAGWAMPSAWRGDSPPANPREAASYLSRVRERGDVLYVHASMRQQIRYYARHRNLSGARLVEGRIGWPCCRHEDTWWNRPVSGQLVEEEVGRIPLPDRRATLRLIFTSRTAHWKDYPAQGPGRFKDELEEKGCFRERVVQFRGVRIDEYRCGRGRDALGTSGVLPSHLCRRLRTEQGLAAEDL